MRDATPQLLGVLALAATDRFRAAADDRLGLSGAHAAALVHLQAHPGSSLTSLAPVLGISQPAAVKVVDRLEERGLVRRERGPDRRTLAVRPTAEGERAVDGVLADRDERLSRLVSVLDPGEREALLPLLEKLVSGLADDRPGALTVCRMCDRDACCGREAGCPLQHTVE